MLSFQVYTYIDLLYTYVLDLNEDTHFTLYNGAAESLNTLIGIITDYNYLLNTIMWCDATLMYYIILPSTSVRQVIWKIPTCIPPCFHHYRLY